MALVEIPIPKATPGSVVVQILASSMNPSDVLNSKGGFPYTTYPRVPGRDFAGVVVDGPSPLVGREVLGTSGRLLGFQEDGAHAEYCLVKEDAVVEKPKNLSFSQAATIGVPYTTANVCLLRGRVQTSDVVLVIGARGSVGSAVAQLALSKGCRVITAARGVSTDIDLTTDPGLDKVKEMPIAQNGVDVVVDTIGDPKFLHAALGALAHGGRLVFIAAPRTGSTELTFDLKALYRNEQEIIGCNSLSYSASEMANLLREMKPLFESGQLKPLEEEHLGLVDLDTALEAYRGVKQLGKSKPVIVFE